MYGEGVGTFADYATVAATRLAALPEGVGTTICVTCGGRSGPKAGGCCRVTGNSGEGRVLGPLKLLVGAMAEYSHTFRCVTTNQGLDWPTVRSCRRERLNRAVW